MRLQAGMSIHTLCFQTLKTSNSVIFISCLLWTNFGFTYLSAVPKYRELSWVTSHSCGRKAPGCAPCDSKSKTRAKANSMPCFLLAVLKPSHCLAPIAPHTSLKPQMWELMSFVGTAWIWFKAGFWTRQLEVKIYPDSLKKKKEYFYHLKMKLTQQKRCLGVFLYQQQQRFEMGYSNIHFADGLLRQKGRSDSPCLPTKPRALQV